MNVFEVNTKVNDIITKEIIHDWNGNVVLDCGTGSGKTYWMMHNLNEYCVENGFKLLYVCNRISILNEVNEKLEELGINTITTTTYQKIESNGKYGKSLYDEYDFICLDEAHHFLEAQYNLYTDISYNYFFKHKAIKIFMSATATDLFNHFVKEGIVNEYQYYYIPKDYEYVDKFIFYKRKDAHLDIIDEIIQKDKFTKIIYFASSIDNAVDVYEKYESIATFSCSESTPNHKARQYNEECKDDVFNEESMKRILVTTKYLDCGVNFHDFWIQHIICDIFDPRTVQQAIARKRPIDITDGVSFYFRDYYRSTLNVYDEKRMLKELEDFKTNPTQFYKDNIVNRDYNNKYIFLDKTTKEYKLNEMAYLTYKFHQDMLNNMMTEGVGYKKYLLSQMGIDEWDLRVEDYETYEEMKKQMRLEEYLDSVVGERLYKEGQKELKEVFKKEGIKTKTVGINTINGYLLDSKMPYTIESDMDNSRSHIIEDVKVKNPNYKKTYWLVYKKFK